MIVDQAEAGLEVELTRHGKPVAIVISHRRLEQLRGNRVQFGDAYNAYIERHSVRALGLEREFFESLRSKETGRKVSL
jgi:prevent-host-death family protein